MNPPALLLVHGYPFDQSFWDWVRPLLNPEIRILTPDLRGFGGQPTGPEPPALEHMADDLHALLSREGVDRAVVAGMSMGGYVALAFAERHPSALAGLGLISSQAAADIEEARSGRRAMIEKVRRDGPQVAAKAAIPKLFAPEHSARPELIRFPTSGADRAGAAGICWALEAMAQRPDRTAVFQALDVPVLVLHGLHDAFIPVDRARSLAALGRQAEFVQVDHAGHAPPLEAPDLVADALNQLVERSFAPQP